MNILNDNNIHKPDNQILLDAHDLAINEDLSLNFISADNKLCKSARHIKELKIQKFFYLKDYIN